MAKKKYYAVKVGREPGIYRTWSGDNGAEAQVKGYTGAVYKGFEKLGDAREWLQAKTTPQKPKTLRLMPEIVDNRKNTRVSGPYPNKRISGSVRKQYCDHNQLLAEGKVIIFTDGSCIGNPGTGGYGAVILIDNQRTEISGGYRSTTNNRMELLACISALEKLKTPAKVVLYTDSRYIVNGVNKGWAKRWRSQNWMRSPKMPAKNADLWTRLLDLCDKHEVQFEWVKGHAGNPDNERCDELSVKAASSPNLPYDIDKKTRIFGDLHGH